MSEIEFGDDGRLQIELPKGLGITEIDPPPKWSVFSDPGGVQFLLFLSKSGCRCWKLAGNGRMTEVSSTVIPIELQVGAEEDYGMKVGDTVRLNDGARGLSVQLRVRFRPGDEGKVSRLFGRFHVEVDVEDKGKVKVATPWVNLVE